MTASEPIPTAIPTSSEAILNQASTSGSIDIPTEVAVASNPAAQALNDGVSIIFKMKVLSLLQQRPLQKYMAVVPNHFASLDLVHR